MSASSVTVTGDAISLWEVEAVARGRASIVLGETARARVAAAHAALGAAMAEGQVLYGVNTGFGSLARQRVSQDQLLQIQRNLVLSHAAGVGQPLPDALVRAML